MNDKIWWFIIVYNLSLFLLIGWSVWYLDSLLPFIALIFSLKYSLKNKEDQNSNTK